MNKDSFPPAESPAGAEVDEGLPLASLELSRGDYFGLRMMRLLPDRLLKLGGALRVFAAKARQLVESASGLCLVVARERGEHRSVQHAVAAALTFGNAGLEQFTDACVNDPAVRTLRGKVEVLRDEKYSTVAAAVVVVEEVTMISTSLAGRSGRR